LHPELDGDALEHSIKEVVASGNPQQLEVELMQGVDRHWYDLSLQPIQSQSGEINRVLGIARDVTKRKQDQEAVKRRTEELAVLYNVAAAVNRSLDLQKVLDVALAEVLGLEMFSDTATGLICLIERDSNTVQIAAHHGVAEDHPCFNKPAAIGECLCGRAAMKGAIQVSEDASIDDRHRQWPEMDHHRDVCLPLRVRDKPLGALNVRLPTRLELKEHQIKLLQALTDQISVAIDNAQLYEAVSRQQEQMRALNARLAEVQESERQRLAYDLHDQTGRDLTALGIQLNLIRSELEGENIEGVHTFLNEAQTLLVELTEQLRDLMADLRPPMLDDYGLMAALRWYGSKVAARTNLAITVEGRESEPRLPPAAEMALFRIMQEALTNVTKHAEATEVAISLDHTDGITRLTIADNGRGCKPIHLPRGNAQNGWGLRIMAERAEANGGRCWIESHPAESGTRVLVEIPR
ncbi:MAG: GAF domain-containing protein, partial [Anaerolineales bacterium]